MIDFELTEDHKALVQTVREFAQKEVAPFIKEWDEKQHFEPSSIGHSQPKALGNAKRTLRSQRCAGLLEAKRPLALRESNWPRRISMQLAGSSTKSVSR